MAQLPGWLPRTLEPFTKPVGTNPIKSIDATNFMILTGTWLSGAQKTQRRPTQPSQLKRHSIGFKPIFSPGGNTHMVVGTSHFPTANLNVVTTAKPVPAGCDTSFSRLLPAASFVIWWLENASVVIDHWASPSFAQKPETPGTISRTYVGISAPNFS